MNYTQDEIEQIIEKGETEKVEFKTFLSDPVLLAKYIGSIANREGGIILVGIREPLEIVGCDIKRLQTTLNRAKSLVDPVPKISFESILIDNKEIGIIEIEKSKEIVVAAGGVYTRIGDRTIPMTPESINNKLLQFSTPQSNVTLAKAIERQTKLIEKLREEIANANSLKNKMKDYILGGIIGAIIGVIVTLLVSLIVN
jgi:predicted HTH transcriptional regulator